MKFITLLKQLIKEAEEQGEKIDIEDVKNKAKEALQDPNNQEVIEDLITFAQEITGKDITDDKTTPEDAKKLLKAMSSVLKEDISVLTKGEKSKVTRSRIKNIIQFLVSLGIAPLASPLAISGMTDKYGTIVAALGAILALIGTPALMTKSLSGDDNLTKDIVGKRKVGYDKQKSELSSVYNKLKKEIEDYWDNYEEDPAAKYSYKTPQMIDKEKAKSLSKLKSYMQNNLDKMIAGHNQSLEDLEKELRNKVGIN